MYRSMHLSMYLSIYLSIYRSIVVVVVVVVVVAVAVVVEVRVVVLVKVLKLVKLVKLISVYFFDISTSKKAQNPQFFTLLTSKCASRHNGVHFFDIWTSKSGPRPPVFNTFDFEMCFAPQRRALFWHLNFQKWSEPLVFLTFWLGNVLRATTACTFQHLNCQKWSGPGVFCTFWLQNVLRATTACTFSTSQLPKVVRPWCVLYILTSKCASRHNGVQIFISHLASWLRTRRFSEPTFRPSGATDHWKNTVFRDFPTFSRICVFCPLTLSLLIFSLLIFLFSLPLPCSAFHLTLSLLIFSLLIFLFSLPLPCSAFHLSILSEVWLLNFLRSYHISWSVSTCFYIFRAFFGGPSRPRFRTGHQKSLELFARVEGSELHHPTVSSQRWHGQQEAAGEILGDAPSIPIMRHGKNMTMMIKPWRNMRKSHEISRYIMKNEAIESIEISKSYIIRPANVGCIWDKKWGYRILWDFYNLGIAWDHWNHPVTSFGHDP